MVMLHEEKISVFGTRARKFKSKFYCQKQTRINVIGLDLYIGSWNVNWLVFSVATCRINIHRGIYSRLCILPSLFPVMWTPSIYIRVSRRRSQAPNESDGKKGKVFAQWIILTPWVAATKGKRHWRIRIIDWAQEPCLLIPGAAVKERKWFLLREETACAMYWSFTQLF